MQKIDFKNRPNTSTPFSADNLNLLQDNVEDAIDTVASNIPTVVDSLDGSSTTNAPSVHAVNYKINTLTTFSTTETVIGTYKNKPLYRKIIEISQLPNTTIVDYSTGIVNIDRITNLYGTTNQGLIINGNRENDEALVGAWYDTSAQKIKISTGRDRSNMSADIVLEYTKTTD